MESVRVSRPLSPGGPPSVAPALPRSAPTRLHGRYLLLARITWAFVAVLTVVCIAVSIPAEFAQLQTVCRTGACHPAALTPANVSELGEVGLSVGFYAGYLIAVELIFAITSFAVGVLIFWRRSDEPMTLFLALLLVTLAGAALARSPAVFAGEPAAVRLVVSFVSFLGNTSLVVFFYLFPDGRFVPRWTWVLTVAFVIGQVDEYFFPSSFLPDIPDPLNTAVVLGLLASIVYAQVYRYRRVSGPVERQQTKWVVFGITAMVVGTQGADVLLPPLSSELFIGLAGYTVYSLSPLFIPLSIGIAILRHRLFDIDLVINRALVYGALTASVVLLYVLVVGGLGAVLQVQGSLIISLIATGLAAVMFQPLRDRLQRWVNRLMYGERDDPYAVLSRLGSRLESTPAHDAVLPAVTRTVKEALKLPYAEIQLKREEGFETVSAAGNPVDGALRLPLVYGGETVGQLVLGPRAGEEGFADAERRLLADLAHQIGASAHAALMTDEALRLSADLQRSRERLVEAREEERRRLRRDLHDGLGPQLSSQALTIDAVRRIMRRDPDAAEELLLDLKADAQDAVSDIRRLVYGLRPPALDDLGLLGALRESAAQYSAKGLSVLVKAPEKLPPLSAAVEVAAYRIAQEALTNVVRHAEATTCTVSLAVDEASVLHLEVCDNGRGIPDPQENSSVGAGVGLTSMRERTSELGGSLLVEPLPEGGTRVYARLPLPKEEE
jgi:signal transduction histidine kinase